MDFTKELALDAGKLLKRKYGKVRNIMFKGKRNTVTEVDLAVEELLVKKIKRRYPDHDILAEETHNKISKATQRWIIDPLDGTNNFAHSYPCFSVSIAYEQDGEVIVGVVYNPLLKEMYWASGNRKDAYLNDKKIRVSDITDITKALACTGFPYVMKNPEKNNIREFSYIAPKVQGIRRDGCASLDLCSLACGRFDVYWEKDLYPWDIAAGKLILEKAGGKFTTFDGSSTTIYRKQFVASNGKLHRDMIRLLKGAQKSKPPVFTGRALLV